MKLGKMKSAAAIMALTLSISMIFAACGSSGNTGNTSSTSSAAGSQASNLTGKVTLSGSTSVQPLAQDLADAFQDEQQGVEVDVQAGGSTQGVKDAKEGTSDIGNASRELTDEEKGWGLTEHVIAYDGIAVVVHPSNPVTNLTKDQIVKIFKGEIKNWKEVGGADKEILVVSREEGSGTRGAFEELLKLEEKQGDTKVSLVRSDALIAGSTGEVTANISAKENAIGYTSLGFVENNVKKVSIDGVECSIDNIKAKKYSISRPFLMLTKGDMRPEVKAFLDFITSDKGQEIVAKKYISIK